MSMPSHKYSETKGFLAIPMRSIEENWKRRLSRKIDANWNNVNTLLTLDL